MHHRFRLTNRASAEGAKEEENGLLKGEFASRRATRKEPERRRGSRRSKRPIAVGRSIRRASTPHSPRPNRARANRASKSRSCILGGDGRPDPAAVARGPPASPRPPILFPRIRSWQLLFAFSCLLPPAYSLPAPSRPTSSSPGKPKEYTTPVYFFGKKASKSNGLKSVFPLPT